MEEDILLELQGNRPRSRTWPLPQPEEVEMEKNPEEKTSGKLEGAKKGSRKNAWGNLSYADLITQAITSSPDQRMTLSQIYTWMVENIPYFKDKGDSTSSAGWKNSIRHNLSLHNRFTRIQNEGNGKSSWWIVDHEAKAEKAKRRGRSSSLDSDANNGTKTKPNKRGRKTKRCENGEDQPQSPSSSKLRGGSLAPKSPVNGEPTVILEDSPFPFPLADYRHRSSSNTSNGRLSPILSHEEEDDTDMSMSPAQELNEAAPVVEELMDSMKESLNMTMGQPQADIAAQFRRCNNEETTNLAPVSVNISTSSPSFVDNRYPATTNSFYQARNLKQTSFSPTNVAPQKNLFAEQNNVHRNEVYHRGSSGSPSQFLAERSISPYIGGERRPQYNHTSLVNNRVQRPKAQQSVGRFSFQANNFTPFVPVSSAPVPTISVEMADSLPLDTDIDFLHVEGDLECDVENVLRNELAFNDGCLDFNLDNYVPAIALPEVPIQGYISGNMVH